MSVGGGSKGPMVDVGGEPGTPGLVVRKDGCDEATEDGPKEGGGGKEAAATVGLGAG